MDDDFVCTILLLHIHTKDEQALAEFVAKLSVYAQQEPDIQLLELADPTALPSTTEAGDIDEHGDQGG